MSSYFIEKRVSYRRISDILKLSPTTINSIQKILLREGGGYRAIFNLISRSSKLEDFLEKFIRLTEPAVPPMQGSKGSYMRRKK